MLVAAFEEISEYFKVIQSLDLNLAKRVKSFGSDEEMFMKWNETLQTCCRDLDLKMEQNTFDQGQDQRDFNQDIRDLSANLTKIFEKLIDHFGSVEEVEAASQKLLEQQEKDRTQYKTQQAVKAEKVFDVKLIRYENIIGIGGFGEVWKARYKGDSVAIKKVPAKSIGLIAIAALRKEAEFMKKLSHPRIVSCFGILEHEGNFCMVMELCPNGSLASFMAEHISADISWDKRNDFAIDIATGMNYLHKLGVIHRDLKLGNVVLDEYDRGKITDFGLSVVKSATQTSVKMDECGTPQYMAPESFGLAPVFSTKSDVYAFAIVLWELSHWEVAYRHVSTLEIKDSIKNGDRLAISDFVIEKIKDLIVDCWAGNPKSRPTYAEILDRLQNRTTFISEKMPIQTTVVDAKVIPSNTAFSLKKSTLPSEIEQSWKTWGKKKKLFLYIGLAITILLLIGAGIGIYVATSNKSSADSSLPIPISTNIITTSVSSTKTITRTPFPTATVSTLIVDNVALTTVYGITLDEDDNLYVIGQDRVVHKITTDGVTMTLIANLSTDGQGTAYGDQGICYYNRALYVPRSGQLTKIDLVNGNLVTRYAGTGVKGTRTDGQNTSAVFCNAISCIPDGLGNIFVGDSCYSIRKVDPTGYVSTYTTGSANLPIAMLMNGTTELLFTGWYPPTVYSLNLQSRVISSKIGNTTTPHCPHVDGQRMSSRLCGPGGLAFDELGNLYIAEALGATVSKVNSTGWVSVFAGSNNVAGYKDDIGPFANFNLPRQMVFDSKGRLFVADSFNNAIRMINW